MSSAMEQLQANLDALGWLLWVLPALGIAGVVALKVWLFVERLDGPSSLPVSAGKPLQAVVRKPAAECKGCGAPAFAGDRVCAWCGRAA
jgi:hypothetical protein